MAANYTTTQVMMTLSGLAALSAAERPSGETLTQQRNRIFAGINSMLSSGTLATGTDWSAVWLGLTQDRANLAYLAVNRNSVPVAAALVLRGTVGGSPIDTMEDLDVGTLLPFADGGGGNISQGAMQAFTEIVNATDPVSGTSMVEAIGDLSSQAKAGFTLFVTGHSLGGAMATTVSLYLVRQTWPTPPVAVNVYTFAAPTAGDESFAQQFNSVFPKAATDSRGYVGTWNQYDVVPNAWWNLVTNPEDQKYNLTPAEDFFPKPNGPASSVAVKQLVKTIDAKTNGNQYVPPDVDAPLNSDYTEFYDTNGSNSIPCWLAELGHQHANDTYLVLLGAPQIPNQVPSVKSLSPASGPYAGTPVTITGTNFTADCGVDFGVVASPEVTFVSSTELTAVAPPGVGIVNVSVTNSFGTSATAAATACYDTPPANPSAPFQFTYQP